MRLVGDSRGGGPPVHRNARREDALVVLEILNEAARRLHDAGIRQWPSAFETVWILPAIEHGATWLFGDDAGTVTLDYQDELWAERRSDGAGYIHRLATRRTGTGLGRAMITWAQQQVSEQGYEWLRLDCVAGNKPLRTIYETLGFVHVGDAEVGGAPGQRVNTGRVTVVSLYEKRVQRGIRHVEHRESR